MITDIFITKKKKYQENSKKKHTKYTMNLRKLSMSLFFSLFSLFASDKNSTYGSLTNAHIR